MSMEFYVVNGNLDVVGIVDSYASAIWTERYCESGDFELYLPATSEMLSLLQKHCFLVRMDDPEKAMVIESVKVSTSAENGNYLTVTGRSLSSILSRRIVWTQTTYAGELEKAVRRIVSDSFINPDLSLRAVSQMALGTEGGFSEEVKAQFSGESVEEAIQALCNPYKLGYRLKMDLANKRFLFELYEGEDRSFDQSDNPYVVFSNDFENLLSTNYSNSDEKFKNVAKVLGEGQGVARQSTIVGSATGLERYETFVNASGQSANEGELDENTYASLLAQKGAEQLAKLSTTEKIDSEVVPNHTFVLNRDYFLGDVVEVVNEYGIEMTPRVVEVIESQSASGYTCIPTFASDD